MQYNRYFGDLIWTNHALERLRHRGLSQEMVWESFKRPDSIKDGTTPGSKEYKKQIKNYTVSAIMKLNDRREWVVISCWVEPPVPGSLDAKKKDLYQRYQRASFWGKLWLTIRMQIGM